MTTTNQDKGSNDNRSTYLKFFESFAFVPASFPSLFHSFQGYEPFGSVLGSGSSATLHG